MDVSLLLYTIACPSLLSLKASVYTEKTRTSLNLVYYISW